MLKIKGISPSRIVVCSMVKACMRVTVKHGLLGIFLLAGDFDRAIESGKKGLLVKEYYVAEQIAQGYILKGDEENAKKYIKILQKHIKGNLFLEKHLEVLSRLYPDKFDAKVVKKLFH